VALLAVVCGIKPYSSGVPVRNPDSRLRAGLGSRVCRPRARGSAARHRARAPTRLHRPARAEPSRAEPRGPFEARVEPTDGTRSAGERRSAR
jgi:hypothetical protein